MTDHARDSWLYMMEAVADRQRDHDHLLVKDPRRLGWMCRVAWCAFFKPAGEFDGIRLVPGLEWRDEA